MLEMVGRDHLPGDYAARVAGPAPVRNLFLAGAWTNSGGQNPAIASGAAAARLAMRLTPAHAHA